MAQGSDVGSGPGKRLTENEKLSLMISPKWTSNLPAASESALMHIQMAYVKPTSPELDTVHKVYDAPITYRTEYMSFQPFRPKQRTC